MSAEVAAGALVGDALVTAFVEAWSSADVARVVALYDEDVLVDLNVPSWRWGVQGTEALAATLGHEHGEFQPGYRVTESRGRATDDGAVVEIEAHFEAEGGEGRFREVHLLRSGAHGIVEHVCYCTGPWSPETIERHAREAPPVVRIDD